MARSVSPDARMGLPHALAQHMAAASHGKEWLCLNVGARALMVVTMIMLAELTATSMRSSDTLRKIARFACAVVIVWVRVGERVELRSGIGFG